VTLNQERIVAGLALLLLVFGAYRLFGPRVAGPALRPIPMDIPAASQEVPRIEPRRHIEDTSGDRNPFQLASDWAPLSPEGLPSPPVDPTRWIALPLGRGADPEVAGFTYLEGPPVELKAIEEEAEKAPTAAREEPEPAGTKPGAGAKDSGAEKAGAGGEKAGIGKKAAPSEIRSVRPAGGKR
jgi:hypothetical protein